MIPIPGMSSHTHLNAVALAPFNAITEDSFPLSSSSGLQDDLISNATLSPPLSAYGARVQIAGHSLPQQGSSSAVPGAPQKKRRTGIHKCHSPEPQPIPSAYLPYHEQTGSGQTTSSAPYNYPVVGLAHMVLPGPLSHAHLDSVASLDSVDASGLHDDSGPSSVASDAEHDSEESDNGKRRRNDNPKDLKATKRLRKQRKIDNHNLEEMRKLLVPDGVGKVHKKDLTTTCTS